MRKDRRATEDEIEVERDEDEEAVEEASKLSAVLIYEVIRRDGAEELNRPLMSLLWSGAAAGLLMGLSILGEAIFRTHLPDNSTRFLIENVGYSFGFLAVILGRLQLFTENTITTVLPVMVKPIPIMFVRMFRLWGVVLAANVIGAFVVATIFARTSAVPAELLPAITELSDHAVRMPPLQSFMRAIPAGVLVAALVWMLPQSEDAAFFTIVTFTWLIAAGDFTHIVAGSVEMAFLAISGALGFVDAVFGFFLPVLAGQCHWRHGDLRDAGLGTGQGRDLRCGGPDLQGHRATRRRGGWSPAKDFATLAANQAHRRAVDDLAHAVFRPADGPGLDRPGDRRDGLAAGAGGTAFRIARHPECSGHHGDSQLPRGRCDGRDDGADAGLFANARGFHSRRVEHRPAASEALHDGAREPGHGRDSRRHLPLCARGHRRDKRSPTTYRDRRRGGLAVASVVQLIWFVRNVAQSVSVDDEIAEITARLRREMARLKAHVEDSPPLSDGWDFRPVVRANATGYVVQPDRDALCGLAEKADIVVRVDLAPGAYVLAETPVMSVSGTLSEEYSAMLTKLVRLEPARSDSGTVHFSVNLLVEIALRALSPGVNDTFTALAVADMLSGALAEIADDEPRPEVLTDAEGHARVILPGVGLRNVFGLAFHPLRRAAGGNVLMAQGLARAYGRLYESGGETARAVMEDHARLLLDDLGRASLALGHPRVERVRANATTFGIVAPLAAEPADRPLVPPRRPRLPRRAPQRPRPRAPRGSARLHVRMVCGVHDIGQGRPRERLQRIFDELQRDYEYSLEHESGPLPRPHDRFPLRG